MKAKLQKTLQLFIGAQIIIVLLSFLLYREVSLLHYINISFFVSSLYILIALNLYIIKNGFFDNITRAFRLFFAGKESKKREIEEMRPLSAIVTFSIFPLLMSGVLVAIVMIVALYYYSL